MSSDGIVSYMWLVSFRAKFWIQQKVENGDSQLTPLEALSSLVTRLLRTAQESRLADGNALGSSSERGHSVMERGRFLVHTPGTWGEPMFAGGHLFSILAAGLVGGCPGWLISSDTDRRNWNVVYSGKRGMVRAGGSASRIIGDRSTTDPGGGDGGSKRGQPAWQLPVERGL